MKNYWGCKSDWEHEQDCEGRRWLHELEECDGPGHCDYCDEEAAAAIAAHMEAEREDVLNGRIQKS